MSAYASADIVDAFRNQLELCKLAKGETVLIFTDPRYVRPEYVPAAFAAACTACASVLCWLTLIWLFTAFAKTSLHCP